MGFSLIGSGPKFEFASQGYGYFAGPASSLEKTLLVPGGPGAPRKFRLFLAIPGFEAQFGEVMRVRIAGSAKGYLTWPAGSVGENVPAPPSENWLLLSFEPESAVIGIHFDTPPDMLLLKREAGGLFLTAKRAGGIGWVRLIAPDGETRHPAFDAGSLSRVAERLAPRMDALSAWRPGAPTSSISLDPAKRVVHVSEPCGCAPPVAMRAGSKGLVALGKAGCYDLRVPTPTSTLLLGSRPPGAERVAGGGPTVPELLKAYEYRSWATKEERAALIQRMSAFCATLTNPAAWEEWEEPQSRARVWRLRGVGGDDALERHAQAGTLLVAALDLRVTPADVGALLAIRRCVEFLEMWMDWATWEPMWQGRAPDAEEMGAAMLLAQSAKRVQWQDREFAARVAHFAARLSVAVGLRIADGAKAPTGVGESAYWSQSGAAFKEGALWRQALLAPMLGDALPLGRLESARYEASIATLEITAGAALSLSGTAFLKPVGATVNGAPVPITLKPEGRFSLGVTASANPSVVVIRFDPATWVGPSEYRPVRDSLR